MNVNKQIKPGTLCKDYIGLFIILNIVDFSIVNDGHCTRYKVTIYDCECASLKQTFITFNRHYISDFKILS